MNGYNPLAMLSYLRTNVDQTILADDTIDRETGFLVTLDKIREVIEALINHFHIHHLTTITAQQREPKRIDVGYHFWAGRGVSIITKLNTSSPQLPSIIDIIPGADFYEREVAEMFGIQFQNRVETPPLLLPDDWDDAPPMLHYEEDDEKN